MLNTRSLQGHDTGTVMIQQNSAGDAVRAATRTLHIRLGCRFQYHTAAGVEFLALVEPPARGDRAVEVRSERHVEPELPLRLYRDQFGNCCWRITAAGESLSFRY